MKGVWSLLDSGVLISLPANKNPHVFKSLLSLFHDDKAKNGKNVWTNIVSTRPGKKQSSMMASTLFNLFSLDWYNYASSPLGESLKLTGYKES